MPDSVRPSTFSTKPGGSMSDWGNQHDEWLENLKQAKWDEGYVQGFEDAKSRYWWKAFAAGWGLVGWAFYVRCLEEELSDCDNWY